jgi:hypothetical protein
MSTRRKAPIGAIWRVHGVTTCAYCGGPFRDVDHLVPLVRTPWFASQAEADPKRSWRVLMPVPLERIATLSRRALPACSDCNAELGKGEKGLARADSWEHIPITFEARHAELRRAWSSCKQVGHTARHERQLAFLPDPPSWPRDITLEDLQLDAERRYRDNAATRDRRASRKRARSTLAESLVDAGRNSSQRDPNNEWRPADGTEKATADYSEPRGVAKGQLIPDGHLGACAAERINELGNMTRRYLEQTDLALRAVPKDGDPLHYLRMITTGSTAKWRARAEDHAKRTIVALDATTLEAVLKFLVSDRRDRSTARRVYTLWRAEGRRLRLELRRKRQALRRADNELHANGGGRR